MNKMLPLITGLFIASCSIASMVNSNKTKVRQNYIENKYIIPKDGTIVDYAYTKNSQFIKQNLKPKAMTYIKSTTIRPF